MRMRSVWIPKEEKISWRLLSLQWHPWPDLCSKSCIINPLTPNILCMLKHDDGFHDERGKMQTFIYNSWYFFIKFLHFSRQNGYRIASRYKLGRACYSRGKRRVKWDIAGDKMTLGKSEKFRNCLKKPVGTGEYCHWLDCSHVVIAFPGN